MEPALVGTPHEINFNGKAYKVRLITGADQAEFERKLAARARERVDSQRKSKAINLSRREYLDELRKVGEREDKGEFAFLKNTETALVSTWGQRTLLELLLTDSEGQKVAKEELDQLFNQRSEEVVLILQKVVIDSMPMTFQKAKEEAKRQGISLPFEDAGAAGESSSTAETVSSLLS